MAAGRLRRGKEISRNGLLARQESHHGTRGDLSPSSRRGISVCSKDHSWIQYSESINPWISHVQRRANGEVSVTGRGGTSVYLERNPRDAPSRRGALWTAGRTGGTSSRPEPARPTRRTCRTTRCGWGTRSRHCFATRMRAGRCVLIVIRTRTGGTGGSGSASENQSAAATVLRGCATSSIGVRSARSRQTIAPFGSFAAAANPAKLTSSNATES